MKFLFILHGNGTCTHASQSDQKGILKQSTHQVTQGIKWHLIQSRSFWHWISPCLLISPRQSAYQLQTWRGEYELQGRQRARQLACVSVCHSLRAKTRRKLTFAVALASSIFFPSRVTLTKLFTDTLHINLNNKNPDVHISHQKTCVAGPPDSRRAEHCSTAVLSVDHAPGVCELFQGGPDRCRCRCWCCIRQHWPAHYSPDIGRTF